MCACGSHITKAAIPYIANRLRWKSFADRSVPQNFSSEIACAVGLAKCKITVQPQKFSSELKFSFAIVKLFHLEQFAIYGMKCSSKFLWFLNLIP